MNRTTTHPNTLLHPYPAGTPASAIYNDAADTATTPMGTPVSGNVLSTANIPAGTTASVTGFSIAGSTQVYPPGSNVTLTDPLTGEPIGTLVLSSSGAYTFVPEPGYVGPTPAISVYSKNSNGVTDVSSLTIDVLPGTHAHAWSHPSWVYKDQDQDLDLDLVQVEPHPSCMAGMLWPVWVP
jgi:hypothetical protein